MSTCQPLLIGEPMLLETHCSAHVECTPELLIDWNQCSLTTSLWCQAYCCHTCTPRLHTHLVLPCDSYPPAAHRYVFIAERLNPATSPVSISMPMQ